MRLNQHKGRHRRALERPFICDYCEKSFRGTNLCEIYEYTLFKITYHLKYWYK